MVNIKLNQESEDYKNKYELLIKSLNDFKEENEDTKLKMIPNQILIKAFKDTK